MKISYSSKEKYLGHYITDDNSMQKSLELDIKERGANVIVKYRNYVNNHPTSTLQVCLKVLQACFTTTILSNCETWGPWIPRKVFTLYRQGIKLALGVRHSTPTLLIFLESRLPCIEAMIRKRQYNFWKSLDKTPGSEKVNLIERAKDTKYIKHYIALEEKYANGEEIFNQLNNSFFEENWRKLTHCYESRTKLKTYHAIYNKSETLPTTSLSLTINKRSQQKITSRYIMSSHNLQSEKGRWSKTPKIARVCKQCTSGSEETLAHFIYDCDKYSDIRNHYNNFPTSPELSAFFTLNNCATILEDLHTHR